MRNKKQPTTQDPALENFLTGYQLVKQHPMFAPLLAHVHDIRRPGNLCPPQGWAVITQDGYLHLHPTRRGEALEWVYVIAHCLLHLGMGHFQAKADYHKWNTACDCIIAKFLAEMKLGRAPFELQNRMDFSAPSEEQLYQNFLVQGIPTSLTHFGTAGTNSADLLLTKEQTTYQGHKLDWTACFAQGLSAAVTSAVNVAAGYEAFLGAKKEHLSTALKAKNWFLNSFPLLGALAATFKIIEDPILCMRMEVSIAAVNETLQEIYLNPAAGLDDYESRFVIAHELLHVGLRHFSRCQGREPYLWNIACDYVINGWLVEMGLGELPKIGVLYDPELKGLSAEAIYDRIAVDLRRYKKLATLRGTGLGDLLDHSTVNLKPHDGVTLDEFYRRALGQGLSYHEAGTRGYLPAGLIEEIRALSQPPVPWDVELAQWFDHYFSPLEKIRSYARPSRRQGATPEIPRPRWIPPYNIEDGRTYGVILDTSGSMERSLLAKALGAIASYSMAREVSSVRVVFCDAVTYDQGYLPPEAIAASVKVKGRGGTILQPGINLLEQAEDFPANGPLLIITDGYCEPLRIRREHAFLIPKGASLPFIPKGKVFRFS